MKRLKLKNCPVCKTHDINFWSNRDDYSSAWCNNCKYEVTAKNPIELKKRWNSWFYSIFNRLNNTILFRLSRRFLLGDKDG